MTVTDYSNQITPKIDIQEYSNTKIARIGEKIKYKIHIMNKSSTKVSNLILHDNIGECIKILPESITINGTSIWTTSVKDLFLGDLRQGEQLIIAFQGIVKWIPECNYIESTTQVEYNYYKNYIYNTDIETSNRVCIEFINYLLD